MEVKAGLPLGPTDRNLWCTGGPQGDLASMWDVLGTWFGGGRGLVCIKSLVIGTMATSSGGDAPALLCLETSQDTLPVFAPRPLPRAEEVAVTE